MNDKEKYKYALLRSDGEIITLKQNEEAYKAGVRRIGAGYKFLNATRLNILAGIEGAGWNVGQLEVYDMSNYFKSSSQLTDQQVNDVIKSELKKGSFFWRKEVKTEKPPFICELGKGFGGIAIMIKLVAVKPRTPIVWQSFLFGKRVFPVVTFVLGFGAETVVARKGNEFRTIKSFYAARMPSGRWCRVGNIDEATEKLTDQDLEALAIFDKLGLVKQIYKSEAKIGKAYLDDLFDRLEMEGKTSIVHIINPLSLYLVSHLYNFNKFFLPSPYQNWHNASQQFEIVLDSKKKFWERALAFYGYLSFGAMVVLDFVPGSKTLKKADEAIHAIRGVKRLKNVEEVAEHVDKLIAKANEGLDDIARRIGELEKTETKLKSTFEEGLDRIKRAKEEGEKIRKGLREGFSALGADEQIRLFQEAQRVQDLTEVIQFANKLDNPLGLRQICEATKGWSPRRRWKAFVEWRKVQRMSGKRLENVQFADEIEKLIAETEELTARAHFNLNQKGFRSAAKEIEAGLQKISAEGLSRREIEQFKEAMTEAYGRLRQSEMIKKNPELLEHVKGMEASGKSGTAFHDSSINHLDDIDCTIWPIDLPTDKVAREQALKVKKQFFDYLEDAFKGKTGSSLKDKNIFVYPEFGKGAFNKATEGYPKNLRSIYEHVEAKGGVRFREDGSLAQVTLRNPESAIPKPTEKEIRAFCKWALKEFRKTRKPKWILKVDKANQFRGVLKYNNKDEAIVKAMGTIYVSPAGKIPESAKVIVESGEEFLRKYAGDPDSSLKQILHIFVFKNKYEAQKAYNYLQTLQNVKSVANLIRILYIQDKPPSPKKPPMKVVKLLK